MCRTFGIECGTFWIMLLYALQVYNGISRHSLLYNQTFENMNLFMSLQLLLNLGRPDTAYRICH